MHEVLKPLGGQAVFLLLTQLALLLVVARLGAELVRRLGLPTVVGELGAGIALGPSLFGRLAPDLFERVFPHRAAQFHLLDVVGSLGMVLLLLLTGLETDVRLLRNLGRAALIASVSGMVLPFALGFVLGQWLVPDQYLVDVERRTLFALFLATAMSISAMPVIAKILVDLGLTRRNIGIVILSAGVVDDTAGWLVLSIIAGVASRGNVHVGELGLTLALLAGFILIAVGVLYPLLRVLVHVTGERFRTPDSDLVLMVVVTLLCAAATERIGVHAVFGAFVAGILLHQVPRLRRDAVHRLESFVHAILAPVFFGIVGLEVDVGSLAAGGGKMLALVLAVACVGKLVGVGLGARWGGMRFWEGASIAVAMNARGAMGIVVATIGLSLGLLGPAMFSIIIIVAVVTSFTAPIGLRFTMPRVRMTEDEAQRILAAESTGVFDPGRVHVLIATGGGPHATAAAALGYGVAARSVSPVSILHVDARTTLGSRLRGMFRRKTRERVDLDEHLARLRGQGGGRPVEVRRVTGADVAGSIRAEAARGYDLIVMGSAAGHTVGGDLAAAVVADAPCHVAIVKGEAPAAGFRRILVSVDGGVAARVAAELALRYAESTGADLTLAVLTEDHRGADFTPAVAATPDEELARISLAFRATAIRPRVVHLAYDPQASPVSDVVAHGDYDLVVLGAENRAIQHRLFFGHDNERLIRSSRVPVAVVVPILTKPAARA